MLKQSHSPRVAIIGQVSKPGEYPFADKLTLPQLVAQAGGLTDLADNMAVVFGLRIPGGGFRQVRPRLTHMVIAIDFADVQKGVKSYRAEERGHRLLQLARRSQPDYAPQGAPCPRLPGERRDPNPDPNAGGHDGETIVLWIVS